MNTSQPVLPKEYGAWAVLLIPIGTSAIYFGQWTFPLTLLLLTSIGAFTTAFPVLGLFREALSPGRNPAREKRLRLQSIVSAAVTVLFLTPLIMSGHTRLILIGLVASAAFLASFFLMHDRRRSVASDLAAVFGLTLTGPAASYVLTDIIEHQALMLWALNFLFFGWCICYVHMKIQASALNRSYFSLKEKWLLGRTVIIFHMVIIVFLILFISAHYPKQFSYIPFIPITVHIIYGTAKLSGRVKFKQLGMALLGESVLFGVLLGLAG